MTATNRGRLTTSLSEGEVFAGYTFVRLLGSGGMGEVYLAKHPRLPRLDALKVCEPTCPPTPNFLKGSIAKPTWQPSCGTHTSSKFTTEASGRVGCGSPWITSTAPTPLACCATTIQSECQRLMRSESSPLLPRRWTTRMQGAYYTGM